MTGGRQTVRTERAWELVCQLLEVEVEHALPLAVTPHLKNSRFDPIAADNIWGERSTQDEG